MLEMVYDNGILHKTKTIKLNCIEQNNTAGVVTMVTTLTTVISLHGIFL